MTVPTRLVLVEGSIGAGKTTAVHALAESLRAELAGSGVGVRGVLEGDPEHPADLERIAAVDDAAFAALVSAHPAHADPLRALTRPSAMPGVRLVPYGVLERETGALPDPIRRALTARDAYELPLGEHAIHRMAQWREFVRRAEASSDVWVLDCVALQNPLTLALVRDDAPFEVGVDLVTGLLDAAAALAPVIVHVRHADSDAAFRRAVADRPASWLEHVVRYYTHGRLGQRLGARGTEGAMQVLRHRAEVEDRLLRRLEHGGVRVSRVSTGAEGSVDAPLAAIARTVADGWDLRRGA